MPALDEHVALALIERGSRLAPLDRAVLMAATLHGLSASAAAAMPVDRRDRLLIDARMASFGSRIGFFARCPHCGEGNEADFDLRDLPSGEAEGDVVARIGGQEIRLRAPSSEEVARAVLEARTDLLIEAVTSADGPLDSADWHAEIERALAEAFPLLDIRFDMICSACEKGFDTRFDIVPWLWGDVEAMAARTIDTVDRLARAYGWTEQEILALSPARRSLYLARLAS